jgi:hypothetical protein
VTLLNIVRKFRPKIFHKIGSSAQMFDAGSADYIAHANTGHLKLLVKGGWVSCATCHQVLVLPNTIFPILHDWKFFFTKMCIFTNLYKIGPTAFLQLFVSHN